VPVRRGSSSIAGAVRSASSGGRVERPSVESTSSIGARPDGSAGRATQRAGRLEGRGGDGTGVVQAGQLRSQCLVGDVRSLAQAGEGAGFREQRAHQAQGGVAQPTHRHPGFTPVINRFGAVTLREQVARGVTRISPEQLRGRAGRKAFGQRMRTGRTPFPRRLLQRDGLGTRQHRRTAMPEVQHREQPGALAHMKDAAAQGGPVFDDLGAQCGLEQQGLQPALEAVQHGMDIKLAGRVEGAQGLEMAGRQRGGEGDGPVDLIQPQGQRVLLRPPGADAQVAVRQHADARATDPPGVRFPERDQAPLRRAGPWPGDHGRQPGALLRRKADHAQAKRGRFRMAGSGRVHASGRGAPPYVNARGLVYRKNLNFHDRRRRWRGKPLKIWPLPSANGSLFAINQ
jgi:hypothetical protein